MASPRKQQKLMHSSGQDMDQNTANVLFENGGILAFFEVPPGTEFGIDYNSWNVGSEFRGVKMIPPGVHFVFYSAVSKESQAAPRTGFFHNFRQKEILIKRWDKRTEDINTEIISAEEQERVESNKKELDRYLGAYPYHSYKKWVSLTNFMHPELIERLQPTNIRITSVAELISEGSNTQSRRVEAEAAESQMETEACNSETINVDSRLPEMKRVAGSEVRFTQIPKKKYPDGASPSEISRYSMDHSYLLQSLLEGVYKDNHFDILGEIQMAFTCFLLGQVYEGFEQWKQLVHLMCSCEEAIGRHQDLYNQLITILHYQIREIPEDFFVDIVTRNNFLVTTLRNFFANLESSGTEESLKVKGRKFKDNLEKRFKWDFTVEDEEDQPVIVGLGETTS